MPVPSVLAPISRQLQLPTTMTMTTAYLGTTSLFSPLRFPPRVQQHSYFPRPLPADRPVLNGILDIYSRRAWPSET
jgi:hypothetical protein